MNPATPGPLTREERKARIAALLGIAPTPEDPRAVEGPAYSRAPWIGLTTYARPIGGGWWVRGFSNYSGHGVDLFESNQGPSDDYDALPDIERIVAKYRGARVVLLRDGREVTE